MSKTRKYTLVRQPIPHHTNRTHMKKELYMELFWLFVFEGVVGGAYRLV